MSFASFGKRLAQAAKALQALVPPLLKLAEATRRNAESLLQLVGVATVLYGISRWSLTATAILGGSGAILVPELRPVMVLYLRRLAKAAL